MTKISPARRLAFDTLLLWEQGDFQTHLEDIFNKIVPDDISPRDRHFAYALVLGVVRQSTLVWSLISPFWHGIDPLPRETRIILQLAIYQLLFLGQIASYAVLNEAVELTKKTTPRFAGAVNAMLRNFLKARQEKKLPALDSLTPDVRYSHPLRLVNFLRNNVPVGKLEQILRWHNKVPRQYARLRKPLEEFSEELQAVLEPQEGFANAVECMDTALVLSSPEFKAGDLYLMQIWSIMISQIPPLKDGDIVADVCAAPGGKSLALLDRANIKLSACDISPSRLIRSRENLARLGWEEGENLELRLIDATKATEYLPKETYDLVLLDAPCSSLGTIQRNPELRWRFRPEELETRAKLQQLLIEGSAPLVKPGGHLLYSVCSFAIKEREAAFYLANDPDWELVTERVTYPGEEERFDGGYYALLRRK